jgi:WhiB family redox-sensing transcriptional regulator
MTAPIEYNSLKSPDNGRWRDHALCAGMGNTHFFEFGAGRIEKKARLSIAEAVDTCMECPVSVECLRFAVDNDIKHGIWGGLMPKERKGLPKSFCNVSESV